MSNEPGEHPFAPVDDMDDRTVPRRPARPSRPAFLLRVDTGAEYTITGRTFVGRSPEPQPAHLGGSLVAIDDPDMSVSKTHAMLDVVGGVLRVSDVGSTNGTAVVGPGGETPLPIGTWYELQVGDRMRLGDRSVEVLAPDGSGGIPASPRDTGLIASVPAAHSPASAPVLPPMAIDSYPSTQAPIEAPPGLSYQTTPPPISVPAAAPARFPRSRKCPACKAKLPGDARFCTECGGTLPPADQPSRSGPPVALLVALGVGGAVAMAAVAWFLLSGDESATSGDGLARPALAESPEQRFEIEIDTEPFATVNVVGTPDQPYVLVLDPDRYETSVSSYDDAAAARWNVSYDGEPIRIETLGGDLLVEFYDGDEATLVRLARSDGEELWSMDSTDVGWWIGAEGVFVSEGARVELLDARTGQSLGRTRLADSSSPAGSYRQTGSFLSWDTDDEELQVISGRFEELTVPIDVGSVWTVSYQGGTVLTGVEDDVTAYDPDGEELFDGRASIDEVSSITPLGGSTWLLSGGGEMEVIRTSDDGIESVWDDDGFVEDVATIGGRRYIIVSDDAGDGSVLDATTGDAVLDIGSGGLAAASNGVLHNNGQRFEAFTVPEGTSLWSERVSDAESFAWLDGGYALVGVDDDEATIEVYS